MTAAYENTAANRARWDVDLPAIAARWGAGSMLRELDATAGPAGALPADVARLRRALAPFVQRHAGTPGPTNPAYRAAPFTDPSA